MLRYSAAVHATSSRQSPLHEYTGLEMAAMPDDRNAYPFFYLWRLTSFVGWSLVIWTTRDQEEGLSITLGKCSCQPCEGTARHGPEHLVRDSARWDWLGYCAVDEEASDGTATCADAHAGEEGFLLGFTASEDGFDLRSVHR